MNRTPVRSSRERMERLSGLKAQVKRALAEQQHQQQKPTSFQPTTTPRNEHSGGTTTGGRRRSSRAAPPPSGALDAPRPAKIQPNTPRSKERRARMKSVTAKFEGAANTGKPQAFAVMDDPHGKTGGSPPAKKENENNQNK